MIFETHAHFDDDAFKEYRDALLSSMEEGGITTIVNISSDKKSIEDTLALTRKYPFVYGAVGIHPCDTKGLTEADLAYIRNASRQDKILAIGEIGLDYYWDEPDRAIQKKWFEAQMELAREEKLPVVIHSRDAAKDTVDMMKALRAEDIGGVVHCYSYSKELAKTFLDMGFYIGVGGVVTFKNARKLKEAVEYIPLDRIVLETDSPYLAPEPNRGKRNSSLNLPYVAQQIADLKGTSYEEVVMVTRKNAETLYRMG